MASSSGQRATGSRQQSEIAELASAGNGGQPGPRADGPLPAAASPLPAVCLVTGATSGIGKATAAGLAGLGATVFLAGRDPERGELARAEIAGTTGNEQVHLLIADLSSQAAVRRLAAEIRERSGQLDVLVNNAGIYLGQRTLTVDGLEMTFAVNHLAPFLLTNLLLDLLQASAPARIVTVSSDAHRGARIDFSDLQSSRHYRGFKAYGRSKLANILFTYELARRLAGTGVTANAVHPGTVSTNFGSSGSWLVRQGIRLVRPFFLTPEQGADTVIYLASSPAVAGVNGRYFVKRRSVRSSRASYDERAQRRLWEISARLAGLSA